MAINYHSDAKELWPADARYAHKNNGGLGKETASNTLVSYVFKAAIAIYKFSSNVSHAK